MRVGIVGAGTAGAAAGTLLARAGHDVTVFERVAEPGPVGAGITIQPTGQAALARLGILGDIVARGARIDRLHIDRPDGRALIDLPYTDVDPTLFGIGTHRGNLFAALFALLKANAKVVCGIGVASCEIDAAGRWFVDESGARHGPFDLAIAADGAVCELHHCHDKVRATRYPWGAVWLVAPDPGGFTDARTIHQLVDGARHMLGILPTGLAPGTETSVVSLFWSIRADRVDAWRAAGLAAWREQVLRLEPRAAPILATLEDLETVLFARYYDVAMWPWHRERLVYLGDAAHGTSPQLGQGANLALMDAVELADSLAAHADLPTALAAYSAARRRHLSYYQFMTRALTPFFQGDSRVLGWLRDRIFPTSRWLRYLRYRMVRTMCGLDRGVLRGPMPLAELKQHLLP